ncbi:hypothetical protein AB835_02300 [Candidatus Endobugula sertula]|uniref:Oxidoreductase n=1 Tax=Candidatus Endobugula sertula TaxID=62101 RepID=A0A1D2QT20_9GAMM|nr:hypothetical protein AB835_02300 [Candidatus Endobugula sertula]
MPNNRHIIKDGQIAVNEWLLVTDSSQPIPEAKVIVSLDIWQAHKEQLAKKPVGLWIKNDQSLETIHKDLSQFDVIAIDFPGFMDGRGFSIGRLLRDRYHYQGEIRATGSIIRDQLCYLKRCGFNAFDLGGNSNLESAIASLNDFSDGYQISVDQKTPLFRRRA